MPNPTGRFPTPYNPRFLICLIPLATPNPFQLIHLTRLLSLGGDFKHTASGNLTSRQLVHPVIEVLELAL